MKTCLPLCETAPPPPPRVKVIATSVSIASPPCPQKSSPKIVHPTVSQSINCFPHGRRPVAGMRTCRHPNRPQDSRERVRRVPENGGDEEIRIAFGEI